MDGRVCWFVVFIALCFRLAQSQDAAGAPPPDSQCTVASNYDILSDLLASVAVISAEDCCTLCATNSSCNAAVFDSGVCDLHSGRGGLVPMLGPIALLVNGRPAPPPPPTTLPTDTPSPSPPVPPGPPGSLPCIPFQPYTPPTGAPPLKYPKGSGGCSCARGDCVNVTPSFNWIFTACQTPSLYCRDRPDDPGCACGTGNRLGPSTIRLNYAAAYQLEPSDTSPDGWQWHFAPQSSLNLAYDEARGGYHRVHDAPLLFNSTSGRNDFSTLPTEDDIYHRAPPHDERVVNSRSGGGGKWDVAIFPYNTTGLQPPAMMFVFSGRLQGAAWFVLNQATLNRGPEIPTCTSPNNCWSMGSAGEFDFLESTNLFGQQKYADTGSESKLWATTYNGGGRCLIQNIGQGAYCHPKGFCGANPLLVKHRDDNNVSKGPNNHFYTNYFTQGGGGPYSLYSYNYDDGEEHVWVAVIDFRGMTLYRDPNFPGIDRYSVAVTLSQLAPTVDSAYTTGACGDPNVYNDEQLPLPCVIHLASAPMLLTPQQWSAATQLAPDSSEEDSPRYAYPGAELLANFWNTGLVQCDSENWWNLFMDTNQLVTPPSIFGTVYTDTLLSLISQPIVVPGINLEPWTTSARWTATIVKRSGGYQTVTRGSLDSACVPGRGEDLLNCPYRGQSMWHPATILMAPHGANTDMCGGVSSSPGACCEECSLNDYQTIVLDNVCPAPCSLQQFLWALPLPTHGGCSPTVPACPVKDATAKCGNMGPYGFKQPGHNQCAVPGFPCNLTMCVTVVGPDNFPLPTQT